MVHSYSCKTKEKQWQYPNVCWSPSPKQIWTPWAVPITKTCTGNCWHSQMCELLLHPMLWRTTINVHYMKKVNFLWLSSLFRCFKYKRTHMIWLIIKSQSIMTAHGRCFHRATWYSADNWCIVIYNGNVSAHIPHAVHQFLQWCTDMYIALSIDKYKFVLPRSNFLVWSCQPKYIKLTNQPLTHSFGTPLPQVILIYAHIA